MAGNYVELYKQSFTSSSTIVVTHNLGLPTLGLVSRVIIGDVAREDLVAHAYPTIADPYNSLTVVLTSVQTGYVQILSADIIFLENNQGVTGAQGPQGTDGDNGAQGYQGPLSQGPQGPEGSQGTGGDQGLQGSQGELGDDGVQGPEGNQGLPGGAQGFQGNIGIDGLQGNQGNQGNQGFQGLDGSGDPEEDLPALQVRRTTNYSLTTSYTDVTWDTVDVENDALVVERDDTNTERIYARVAGVYMFSWVATIDTSATTAITMRLYKNGSSAVAGSVRSLAAKYPMDMSDAVVVELGVDDYITLQGMDTTDTAIFLADFSMVVTRLRGSKGAIGAQGLQGTNPGVQGPQGWQGVVGEGVQGPIGLQGFQGSEFVFGTEFQSASSEGESTTTSATFQQKLRMTTPSLPSGNYRIGYYCEIAQTNLNDVVESRVQINDTTTIASSHIEPSDVLDYLAQSGFYYATSISGVLNIDIDYRQQDGSTAKIRRARLEIWRIS